MAWIIYKLYNRYSNNQGFTVSLLKKDRSEIVFVLSNKDRKYILWDGIYFITFVNFSNCFYA